MTDAEFKAHIEQLQRDQNTKLGHVCDFCGLPPGAWIYLCERLDARWDGDTVPFLFAPEWAACPDCHALIEKNDRAGLLDRWEAVHCQSFIAQNSPADASQFKRQEAAQVHALFFAHRVPGVRPVPNSPDKLRPN